MTSKNPYRPTGPLDLGAYVERDADQRLRKELLENKRYPFVTGPADSGKSSLLRKTLTSLEPHKYCGVLVDISRLRIQDYTQFMGEFLSAIAKEGDFDTREISSDSPEDTFLAWLGTFPQRLIVFMDGVENCGRGYTGEQIFGKFKFLFNVRDENDEFLRLQFVLSSSQPLSKVVSPQLQTPFLGSELPVLPLSPEQVDGLAWQLNTTQVAVDPHIGALVYRHTSGVAVLCQQLLAALWDEAQSTRNPIGVVEVNRAVDRLIERADKTEHFVDLFRLVTGQSQLLDSFVRLRRGQSVDPQRLADLQNTGLCGDAEPYRCAIYERVYGPGGVFDLTRAAMQKGAGDIAQSTLAEPPRTPRTTDPGLPKPPPVRSEEASIPRMAVPVAAPPPVVKSDFGDADEATQVDRPGQQSRTGESVQNARLQLEEQLSLATELDAFCLQHFPKVMQLFAPGMSRAAKTDILLAQVEPREILSRLAGWSSAADRKAVSTSQPTSRAANGASGPVTSPQPKISGAVAAVKAEPALTANPAKLAISPVMSPMPMGTADVVGIGIGLVLANRYLLTSEVGRGSVATVWNAYDRIKDEQVALKLLHDSAAQNKQLVEKFWKCAQQMGTLSHPGLVSVLNKPREENGTHYVVLEYVPGGNLRQWVTGGKLPRTQLVRVLQRLGASLSYIHERKIVHRNIKPTNVLFDSAGQARLTDVAIVWPSEFMQTAEARDDRMIYMAPEEQLGNGSSDPRADIYSLGMLALFVLYGQELTSKVLQDRAAFIEALDANPVIKAAIRRAVSVKPEDRYASAADFCRALEQEVPAPPAAVVRSTTDKRGNGAESGAIKGDAHPRAAAPPPPIPAVAPPPVPPAPPSAAAKVPPPKPAAVAAPKPPVASAPKAPLPPLPPRPLDREDSDAFSAAKPGGKEGSIGTDRVRALSPGRNAGGISPELLSGPPPKRSYWGVWAFAGLALVCVGGAMWYSLQPMPTIGIPQGNTGTPVVASIDPVVANKPVVEALPPKAGEPTTPTAVGPALNTPVIPINPDKGAGTVATGTKTSVDPSGTGETKVALLDPKKSTPEVTTAKTDTAAKPVDSATTAGKMPVVATAEKPVAPPPVAATAGKEPKAQPPVTPPTAKEPVVQATAPKAVTDPKTAVNAKPVTPPPVVAPVAPRPVVKVTPTAPATPVRPPVAIKTVTPPIEKPVAVAAVPALKSATPEGTAALNAAQTAFVQGDRQGAIAMALRVTERGGEDAIKAWRFVGGAACSVRSGGLASSAYRHLRDPDHKRMLVELCQRNGGHFSDSQFVFEE